MDNFNNVNITAEAVLSQKANESQTPTKKVNTFNILNYLNTRLSDKETSKTLVIRLLPFSPEGGTPFHKVHMHQVRVNKEVSSTGWKTLPCPIHNGVSSECPFCETSKKARELRFASSIEAEKKKYGDVEFANRAREFWIVRCIERGHEEDGVKFWLFSHSKKGDGAYDKIMNIFTQRYNKAKELGKENNIFDLNQGKDLYLTITRDSNGKSVINVADDDEKTPLSANYEQALAWVNDEKKWTDVYTTKPYDYMEILLCGGIPKFDKEVNKYIDKSVADAIATKEIEENLTRTTVDLSVAPTQSTTADTIISTASESEYKDDIPF